MSLKSDFPQVDCLKILLSHSKNSNDIEYYPILHLVQKHTDYIVHEKDIASGILKTLFMIAQIHLLPKGTVVLVDEIENSLGVNCMDSVLENIIFENRGQFILTSHHPYIINNIPYERWLIITRENGEIKAHKAAEFDLGKSRQENFIKLINLKEFQEGVIV